MKIHLQRELEGLKKSLFHLSSVVEESLKMAIRAVDESDAALAARVKETDTEIDRLEVQVEEECLKILALHQPVAVDLRFLVAVLKMNNDLERIGDLAVNIAGGEACRGGDSMPGPFKQKIHRMGEMARTMFRGSLEALMDMDAERARGILMADDEVDEQYYELMGMLRSEMATRPADADKLICWILVAKNIERVADLATNIAEDTIYTVTGDIVRHGGG
ncbi:phosphate transport system regulatory protein PhoU [bacterium]|nr:MAG: phosphate transport system regulatory protein PhoU [bacterium]